MPPSARRSPSELVYRGLSSTPENQSISQPPQQQPPQPTQSQPPPQEQIVPPPNARPSELQPSQQQPQQPLQQQQPPQQQQQPPQQSYSIDQDGVQIYLDSSSREAQATRLETANNGQHAKEQILGW